MTRRFGFTLAEVLITLTIIGVIAAMTIPTLLSNTSDQEFKTGLKKAISTINQAITMQYALEGTEMSEYTYDSASINNTTAGLIGAVFKQRMQVVNTTTSRATGSTNHSIYLSDGMVIEFPSGSTATSPKSKACTAAGADCIGTILVDVNGDKGKCTVNTATTYTNGKVTANDCFPLDLYKDGVRPANFVGREIMYSGK